MNTKNTNNYNKKNNDMENNDMENTIERFFRKIQRMNSDERMQYLRVMLCKMRDEASEEGFDITNPKGMEMWIETPQSNEELNGFFNTLILLAASKSVESEDGSIITELQPAASSNEVGESLTADQLRRN